MKTNRDVIEAGLRAIGREDAIGLLPESGHPSIVALDDPNEGEGPMLCLARSCLCFVWIATDQGHGFWENIVSDLSGTDFPNISVSDLWSNNADINAAMLARDEEQDPPMNKPHPPWKPGPAHWTARMAPVGVTNPAFFGFLRR